MRRRSIRWWRCGTSEAGDGNLVSRSPVWNSSTTQKPRLCRGTIITLALGIGVNTIIFSVVNGVLLSPLPFTAPDQLVTLHENKPNFEGGSLSYPNFRDWQKDNHTFSSMASRGFMASV